MSGLLKWLVGFIIAVAVIAAVAVWSPYGAAGLAHGMLSGYAGGHEWQTLRGNLFNGFVIEDLVLKNLKGEDPQSWVRCERILVGPIRLLGFAHVPIRLERVQLNWPGRVQKLTVSAIKGSVFKGWSLEELEAKGIAAFPVEHTLKIQRLEWGSALHLRHMRSIYNARLTLPISEPIILFARQNAGKLDVQGYSKALSIQELLAAFSSALHVPAVRGTCTDVEWRAQGSWEELKVEGSFIVQELLHKRLQLNDAQGQVDLTVNRKFSPVGLLGTLTLRQGILSSKTTLMRLRPSLLRWDGNPMQPAVDVGGTAVVDNTTIRMNITGKLGKPQVRLSSSPPMGQRRLLAMLVTGKSWSSAETLFGHDYLSTELAQDFIDYFVFGGSVSRIAKQFGLSELALTYNPETGEAGAKTLLFDRVEASYVLEPPTPNEPNGTIKQRGGAGYRFGEATSISVEAEKSAGTQSLQPPTLDGTSPEVDPTKDQHRNWFDRLFLIFRRKF
ncbi:MAG: translocation/assembly module TamB domain-containing protein [Candidatus Omnitrophica bacterium]|nr:translocation/assembly module TamB domain-containing protein [Candidatus Omnitrophota bacterium]MBI2174480.1 translocation/assembly module TamB domain-containing protein [Candidatus Omnitrophota bacterium]